MCDKTIPPREQGATIASVFPSATDLGVGFPIGLNCVFLGTLLAFPLLLAVFPAEVFLDPSEVS